MHKLDLSDKAIHATLTQQAPISGYCLVAGCIYVQVHRYSWLRKIIENNSEAHATVDYLRRMGVPVFSSSAEWAAWVKQQEV